jgi:hypothetical protein
LHMDCDFFLSVKGHAKLMHEFFSNNHAPMYLTAMEEKIKFHLKGEENPDWIVKQYYLLLIASMTESQTGIKTSLEAWFKWRAS